MPAAPSTSRTTSCLLLMVSLLHTRSLAASPNRTFTILNNCDFTLWPAITNYGTDKQQYTGVRGWEAKSGSSKELKVPSPWNGRIWSRRDCQFDENGKGSCTTGNVEGGIEPKDQTIGNVNVGEFNLDTWGGNDFWDISCVPGWTVTMAVEPEPEDCQSVTCADDLNEDCPDDRLKQKDSTGKVIGCLSACMAGINAQDPSINCCSGKYNSKETCPSAQVDFYDKMKPRCQNAYWYPYDYPDNTPTVDWACPSSKNADYKITFCPAGETTRSGSTVRAGGVTFVGDAAGTNTTVGESADAESTGKTETSSPSRDGETGGGTESTSVGSDSQTSPSSPTNSYEVSETNVASTRATPTKSSTTSSASTAPDSSESTNESTIFGYPPTTVYLAAIVLASLVILIGLLACNCGHGRRRNGGKAQSREMSITHVRKPRRLSGSSDDQSDTSDSLSGTEVVRGDSGHQIGQGREGSLESRAIVAERFRPLLPTSGRSV